MTLHHVALRAHKAKVAAHKATVHGAPKKAATPKGGHTPHARKPHTTRHRTH